MWGHQDDDDDDDSSSLGTSSLDSYSDSSDSSFSDKKEEGSSRMRASKISMRGDRGRGSRRRERSGIKSPTGEKSLA